MIPAGMKGPADRRATAWRGGTIHIKILSYCDLDCQQCDAAVGILRGLKLGFVMTPEQFRIAARSLNGYFGLIGIYGGNPCMHPQFEEICRIFAEEIPDRQQRGLWTDNLRGQGKICRETFNPAMSNLNCHGIRSAYDEMRQDWPEAKPIGLGDFKHDPSEHAPYFGSMADLGLSDEEMEKRLGDCGFNQEWSAMITQVKGRLVAYFCEIAATMAEVMNDPSRGMTPGPGWWSKPLAAFENQICGYCTRCLIPMNGRKSPADARGTEQYTKTWEPVFATIKGRPMVKVVTREEIRGDRKSTLYGSNEGR